MEDESVWWWIRIGSASIPAIPGMKTLYELSVNLFYPLAIDKHASRRRYIVSFCCLSFSFYGVLSYSRIRIDPLLKIFLIRSCLLLQHKWSKGSLDARTDLLNLVVWNFWIEYKTLGGTDVDVTNFRAVSLSITIEGRSSVVHGSTRRVSINNRCILHHSGFMRWVVAAIVVVVVVEPIWNC